MPSAESTPPAAGGLFLLPPPSDEAPDTEPRRGDVDAWGRSQAFRDLLNRVYEPIYRHWFRVSWEGLEKVPLDGGALLVANHAGAIPVDAPLLMHGVETELGRPIYGLGDYLFRSLPLAGTLWARAGGVPGHPDNAYRLLVDERALVVVFPEGTKGTGKLYGQRYQLQRFGRGGFVEIAMRAGVPIVPIAVMGNEEAMPILARSELVARMLGIPYAPLTANMLLLGPLGLVTPFPVKVRFRVLDPVHFDVEPGAERYPRSKVLDEAESVRQSLQAAVGEMLAARRSVWSG